jgi:hypothetical protein
LAAAVQAIQLERILPFPRLLAPGAVKVVAIQPTQSMRQIMAVMVVQAAAVVFF